MYIITYIFILSLIIPIIVYLLSYLLFIRSLNDRHKTSPFECGFDPYRNARIPFSTRFFLLAIIFIVFDIEVVLLIPSPLLINSTIDRRFLLIFYTLIIILFIGLIHEWNEGSINWIS